MMHVMEPARSHATLMTSGQGQGQGQNAAAAAAAGHAENIVPAPAGFKDEDDPAGGGSGSHPNPLDPDGGQGQEQEAAPEVDIVINNVVCSFSVKCHLDLRDIALRGVNVEYRRENGVRNEDDLTF